MYQNLQQIKTTPFLILKYIEIASKYISTLVNWTIATSLDNLFFLTSKALFQSATLDFFDVICIVFSYYLPHKAVVI